MNLKIFIALSVLTAVAVAAQAGAYKVPQLAAACAIPETLNGVWQSNDGGIYILRQIGSQVWWSGKSGDDGRSWTTMFHGTRLGNTVKGRWADLPAGKRRSSGNLTFRLIGGAYGANSFNRVSVTGHLKSSGWSLICNDVVPSPPLP